jgi:enterochelin esterase-like enzyme
MNKFISLLLLCMLGIAPTAAQLGTPRADDSNLPGKRGELNVRVAVYPRILPDNRVEFKIKAPNAQKVQVDLAKKYDLKRNAEGVWEGVTEPVMSGFSYYFLYIDDVQVSDPAAESFFGCSMMSSGIEIPYPEGVTDFYLADVPHGDIRMKRYYSATAGDWRRMFVYCPPGYDASGESYPVLYLQHGGGEDERGWSQQGRTDIIMDNLIAKGQAVPMIIVMTDGNTRDFEASLLDECIPFVEKNFRVKTDREHRALAGLSMGGIQTLNVGIPHPELFSYLGVFSSGWWTGPTRFGGNDSEKCYALLKENKELYNRQFKQFWLSMGGPEDIAYNNCQTMMKRFDEIGIKYSYFETPGGHTWPVWRESLLKFAPLLFR